MQIRPVRCIRTDDRIILMQYKVVQQPQIDRFMDYCKMVRGFYDTKLIEGRPKNRRVELNVKTPEIPFGAMTASNINLIAPSRQHYHPQRNRNHSKFRTTHIIGRTCMLEFKAEQKRKGSQLAQCFGVVYLFVVVHLVHLVHLLKIG